MAMQKSSKKNNGQKQSDNYEDYPIPYAFEDSSAIKKTNDEEQY